MTLIVRGALSDSSWEWFQQYLDLLPQAAEMPADRDMLFDYVDFIFCLEEIDLQLNRQNVQEVEFLIASLRAELLRDLLNSMEENKPLVLEVQENLSSSVRMKFILLALAGTLLAACEGFDSITALLAVLSFPALAILIAGLGFSILSMMVFYGIDLIKISNNLGMPLGKVPKLLDIYLLQLNEIKAIRKKIDTYVLARLSLEELVHLTDTISMLERRLEALAELRLPYNNAVYVSTMQFSKTLVSGMVGLLFFGSGFFAGQSVAIFFANFLLPAVLPAFWPVVLFSTLVGMASFARYWHLEQDELRKLVSSWFGLDEEKIEQLCDEKALNQERSKLDCLKEQLLSTAQLKNEVRRLSGEPEINMDPFEFRANRYPLFAAKNLASAHFCLNPQDEFNERDSNFAMSCQ